MKTYKVVNGLSFAEGTDDQVCNILSNIGRDTRIRVWYGDTKTGRSWIEENDVTGYVGRSAGTVKVPILINNIRSCGGGAILCERVVKIVDTRTRRVLYQHPTFNQPVYSYRMDNGSARVDMTENQNTTFWAKFFGQRAEARAARFCDFMNGKRMSK